MRIEKDYFYFTRYSFEICFFMIFSNFEHVLSQSLASDLMESSTFFDLLDKIKSIFFEYLTLPIH